MTCDGSSTPPPEFWSTSGVVAALASCDMPALIEALRVKQGWTQGELAEVLGYSQSWASKVLRGRLPLTVHQVREISQTLGIPVHLLRFGPLESEDHTKRRQFTKTVALAALAGLPAPRTAEVDENTAMSLRTITGGHRRLDATSSTRELARAAIANLELATRLASKARGTDHVYDVSAAASEAAGFTGWLHADMYDIGSARTYYRTAVKHAQNTQNALLHAYMLGSLASFEIDGEEPALGLALIREARTVLNDRPPPTAEAWLSSIEALGYASIPRHAAHSDQAIKRAERAISRVNPNEPPPWPWVFPFDHSKMTGYRALAAVRLGRTDDARTAFAESLPVSTTAPKQRAVLTLELAEVHTQAGTVDEGFQLATTALNVGKTYASERVIQRARRFRRRYTGPASVHVRDFDDRLRATLL